MGDAIAVLEKLKNVLMIDKVIDKIMGYVDLIPDFVKNFYYAHRDICLIVAICLLVLVGFEGYKLFKMALYAGSAAACLYLGKRFLAPLVVGYFESHLPDYIDSDILVGAVCALIAVFLCRCAFNFMIMVLGGACGYFFGALYVWRVIKSYFNTLEFLEQPMAKYIIGGVFAAICVILFVLLFKHAFIVGSSFGCLAAAGWLLQKLAASGATKEVKFAFIIVGAVIGIFALIHQYKEEERATDVLFR